jgi:hypothetical protein
MILSAAGTISIAVSDFNGDGKPDFVVGNEAGNTASVFVNTTVNTTVPPDITDPLHPPSSNQQLVGDKRSNLLAVALAMIPL